MDKRLEKIPDEFLDLDRILLIRTKLDIQRKNFRMAVGHILSILHENPNHKEANKLLRSIASNEEIVLDNDIKERINGILILPEDIQIQEKAKKFARKFISEHYPKLKSQFNLAWEAILKIPEGARLVLSKKELPALGFTDSERKTDQLLLFKILFTIRNVFYEIDENTDIDQFKMKIQNFAKQNKLSNKIKNQLIELIISDKNLATF